jgi:hypothetical protein
MKWLLFYSSKTSFAVDDVPLLTHCHTLTALGKMASHFGDVSLPTMKYDWMRVKIIYLFGNRGRMLIQKVCDNIVASI